MRRPAFIKTAEDQAFWDEMTSKWNQAQQDTLDEVVTEMEQAEKHHIGEWPVRWWANYLQTRSRQR